MNVDTSSKYFPFTIVFIIVVCSSIISWFLTETYDQDNINDNKLERWSLAQIKPGQASIYNQQLTDLKLWTKKIKKQKKIATKKLVKAKAKKWVLKGVSVSNNFKTALFEIAGQQSLKRVAPSQTIIPGIKLISINDDNIVININGKVNSISLYQ